MRAGHDHRRAWQAVGVAGGLAGAAATGAAVSVAARRRHRDAVDRHTLATQLSTGADDTGALPAGDAVVGDGGRRRAALLRGDRAAAGRARRAHRRARARVRARPAHLALPAPVPGRRSPSPVVRQVIYDQRSHGRSERAPRASCTIDQLGHDLAAVLRALAPDGPLVLVGPLDGRHDDHGARRAAAGAVRRAGARASRSWRRPRPRSRGRGLPGTLLSRRNPLTRGVGPARRLAAAAGRGCAAGRARPRSGR